MRLFLSSQDLGNYAEVFKNLAGANKKLAFSVNAKDDWPAAERAANAAEHLSEMQAQGFESSELDLRKFFGKQKELESWLKDFGAVFMYGGNTFILRRAMAASGFDSIIKKRLADDSIAYGGSSAGSCVTAPDLHAIDSGDRPDPSLVPNDYPIKEIIWEGLGLVPFLVVPHWEADWFQKNAEATVKELKKLNHPYKILRDGQVIVINGDKTEFLA